MTIEPKPDLRDNFCSIWYFEEMQILGLQCYEATRVLSVLPGKWEAEYWADEYVTIGIYDTREEAEQAAQIAFDMRLYSDRDEPRS